MKITKITIGRLFNLGSYEHVRYELTAEVPEGESAAEAVTGMERILSGLAPIKSSCINSPAELKRKADEIERMKTMPVAEWERNYGHCKGTPSEVIARYQEDLENDVKKSDQVVTRAKKARQLFNNLGGAAQWKDAKLDWEDDYQDEP